MERQIGPALVLCALLVTATFPSPAHAAVAEKPAARSFANVQVSQDAYPAHSEPVITESPTNPRNLVAASKFFTDPAAYQFHIGTYVSFDGGRSWRDNGVLPDSEAWDLTSDVSLAFGPGGKILYACALGLSRTASGAYSRSGVYVWRSLDGGATWSHPVTVFEDLTGATFSDKSWIAVDAGRTASRGTVYVAWNLDDAAFAADDGDIGQGARLARPARATRQSAQIGLVVSRSTDRGQTFSAPVPARKFTGANNHFALGALPAVAPDGHLFVAYLAYDDVTQKETTYTVYRMAVAESGNHGRAFRTHIAARRVSVLPDALPHAAFRTSSLPAFAISPTDGSMVVAWADHRNHRADILSVTSRDGGKTWSSPSRINHDSLKRAVDHFQPALAVSSNGAFTCAWFDRRYAPGNRLIDEAVAQSTDAGRSFGRNLRVTERSWDPAIGAPRVPGRLYMTFIGDYQGLAVDNAGVHPLWNDTQDGASQQIRTAVVSAAAFAR